MAFFTTDGPAGAINRNVPKGGALLFAATVTGKPIVKLKVFTSFGCGLANIRVAPLT